MKGCIHPLHLSEREKKREKEGQRKRGSERERERERDVELFLKGMAGALAPFNYLVKDRMDPICCGAIQGAKVSTVTSAVTGIFTMTHCQ
jgi:hypothetical protein